MGKYKIAGIKLEFNYCFDTYFKDRIDKYIISEHEKVDCVMNVYLSEKIEFPKDKLITKNKIIYTVDNVLYIYILNESLDKVNVFYQYHEDYQFVNIHISKDLKQNLSELEYIISGMMFLNIAIRNGCIPIHASAISHQNQAILFSGPSTTGKSTHANLWKEVIKDITIINDDKPLLTFKDGLIYAEGSPWSGKSVLNDNIKIKLKAIVFLRQSDGNYIEELSNKDKLTHLMRNTQRPTEENLINVLIERFNTIIKEIPIFLLNCNISDDAVWTVYNKLYKENNDEN